MAGVNRCRQRVVKGVELNVRLFCGTSKLGCRCEMVHLKAAIPAGHCGHVEKVNKFLNIAPVNDLRDSVATNMGLTLYDQRGVMRLR